MLSINISYGMLKMGRKGWKEAEIFNIHKFFYMWHIYNYTHVYYMWHLRYSNNYNTLIWLPIGDT